MRGLAQSTAQRSRVVTTPAPTGGWDTRSPIAGMPIDRALVLDNWFPEFDTVSLRPGSSAHATFPEEFSSEFSTEFTVDQAPDVETLMAYIPPSGTARLFAGNGVTIYDVTSAGVASVQKTGFTSVYFVHTQFGNAAGNFLFAANGLDTLQRYDGSTWADSTITGPTLANVAWVTAHQNRLWMGEKNSLTAWYLATSAVAGAATSISLASYATDGGYLVGMGTWTRDGGDGADDIAVFLTSEGQALVFQGDDPSSSTTWALVGVFRIGRPLNRRSMIKAGSDLIVVTENGIVPLSRILPTDKSQSGLVALSGQIDQAFADAVRDALGLSSYWQVLTYPKGPMMIVNVPRNGADSVQFVFNTLTGAPCRFTGLPANCWATINDRIYYGGEGFVARFDDGDTDRGSPIVADAVQAFSYLGSQNDKRASRVQMVMRGVADPAPSVDVMTDFAITTPSGLRAASPSVGALWDVDYWDVDYWDADVEQNWQEWEAVQAHGRSMAVRMRINSIASKAKWLATNWLITSGGPL
jgi:hypothetical protein